MPAIVAVHSYSEGCLALIAGDDILSSMIVPMRPDSTAGLLLVKQLAVDFFSRLEETTFSSQCSLSIRNAAGELVAEYTLSGHPQFEIEPASLATVAQSYLNIAEADVQVVGGAHLSEREVRELVLDPPPGYSFSSPIKPKGRVQCCEEFHVAVIRLLPDSAGRWLIFCDASGVAVDLNGFELCLPELPRLFSELHSKVQILLER